MAHRTIGAALAVATLWILLFLPVFSASGGLGTMAPELSHHPLASHQVWAEQGPDQPDIEWFRDQMRISPKYLETEEGILGMSWLHFLTMFFLVIFFIGALIAVYLRNRRTKQILASLLKEESHDSKG